MADFLLVLVIVLSTIWGYFRGALYNLLGLVALVVAVVGSAPFGGPLGGFLARRWDVSAGPSYLLGRLAAGVLIFASLKVSAWAINRKFGKTRLGVTHRWNRNLGALVGALSGFVTVLIILFVADSIVKAFPEQEGRLVGMARASGLRRMVSDVNPADRFLLTDVLRLLRIARQDPEVTRKLRRRPEIREILEHPDFRRVAQNEELVQAMERREYARVLRSDDFQALLANDELIGRLFSRDVRTAVREVVEQARASEEQADTSPEQD